MFKFIPRSLTEDKGMLRLEPGLMGQALKQTLHLPAAVDVTFSTGRHRAGRLHGDGWEGVGSRLTETGRWRNLSDWWSLLERLEMYRTKSQHQRPRPLDGNSRVSGRGRDCQSPPIQNGPMTTWCQLCISPEPFNLNSTPSPSVRLGRH